MSRTELVMKIAKSLPAEEVLAFYAFVADAKPTKAELQLIAV